MTQTSKETIKYRVIGALVIVLSLSLAWWLLLDHDVRRLENSQQGIPLPIKIKRIELPKETPKNPDATTDAVKVAQELEQKLPEQPESVAEPVQQDVEAPKIAKLQSKADSDDDKSDTIARLNSQGLPEAWVLQVASFKHEANASSLKDKLLAKDFPAYVKIFNLPEGEVYRVLIGPKLSKEKATSLSKSVEKAFSIKTMLVAYQAGFEQ